MTPHMSQLSGVIVADIPGVDTTRFGWDFPFPFWDLVGAALTFRSYLMSGWGGGEGMMTSSSDMDI